MLGLVCAGSKSSALPPLIAGLGLTAVVVWWRKRQIPRPALVALACLVAAMAIGFRLFAGGGPPPCACRRWRCCTSSPRTPRPSVPVTESGRVRRCRRASTTAAPSGGCWRSPWSPGGCWVSRHGGWA
ncbi:hypothetical protein NKG94_34890 [Micromonospora sp. M12]